MKASALWALAVCLGVAACASAAESKIPQLERRIAELEQRLVRLQEIDDFVRPLFEQSKRKAEDEAAAELDPDTRFAVSIANLPTLGPATAPVTLVEAFDFVCPYCAQSLPVLEKLSRDYGSSLRIVLKNYVIHDDAEHAHVVGCSAERQGIYQKFAAKWWVDGFGKFADTGDASFVDEAHTHEIARAAGVDLAKLKQDTSACLALVQADTAELKRLGVKGTPAFFVNGRFTWYSGEGDLRELIEEELATVQASGVPAAEYYQKEVLDKGSRVFVSAVKPGTPSK